VNTLVAPGVLPARRPGSTGPLGTENMRAAVAAAVVLCIAGASVTARAHELQCTKEVGWVVTGEGGAPVAGEDGLPVFDGPGPVGVLQVDRYPIVVAFQVTVTNIAAGPSEVAAVVDPLDHWTGSASWSFGAPIELGSPFSPGESKTFALGIALDSYETCLALAAHVSGDAPVCGGVVPNRYGLLYVTGYAECRAELVCLPPAEVIP
jgi:hypothetical protein